MKKLFFAAMLLMTSVVSANADNDERAINVAQLPQTAQSFLTANFSGKTVAFAVEERKFFGTEYEVVYTDRTEVSFRSDGEWESVETKYEQVPSSVVPAQIADFVAKGGFEGQFIKEISRDRYSWEITLSSGIEIKFDKQFNVIGYDD
ncbi:MAG TPA: PepSY-like domain-containing protein [Candidatus Avibacteroides excrementipullorum]|jgi:hypothetical protein|nr:PepSY-like domain-containing protein [Candidatus Avibacteroides excrementipullorum]